MSRWVYCLTCLILGLVVLLMGWLVPMHLRATDLSVIQMAGRKSPALVEQGLALVNDLKLGPAQMLLEAAQLEKLPNCDKLEAAVRALGKAKPGLLVWGSGEPRLERLFGTDPQQKRTAPEPLIDFVVRLENRGMVIEFLKGSPRPAAQELLRTRSLTNTTIFPASSSTSGQAFDAALSVCALLLVEGRLTTGLSNSVYNLAWDANHGATPQRYEQVLLDLMSLGQRLNWGQMASLVGGIEDNETLRLLCNHLRRDEKQRAVIYAAVQLSGKPAEVTRYLMTYSQTGLKDLGMSLHCGTGGVKELLKRNLRLEISPLRQKATGFAVVRGISEVAADYALDLPWFALGAKWSLYLLGGFLLAAAAHYGRHPVSALQRPLEVRGFHFAREFLFALGFLVVVLLLSEPFLSQDSQKVDMPFRLRLPTVGSVAAANPPTPKTALMNQLSLLTLLLFFVLQALIYIACLVKLAEIRRQNIVARIKLRLLENEDHLFDAGLYLGFVGTIISLILVSLGVIKPSLMAAYSSTSFGIIFCSVFKIFHLRPLRRQYVLESEQPAATAPATGRALATS